MLSVFFAEGDGSFSPNKRVLGTAVCRRTVYIGCQAQRKVTAAPYCRAVPSFPSLPRPVRRPVMAILLFAPAAGRYSSRSPACQFRAAQSFTLGTRGRLMRKKVTKDYKLKDALSSIVCEAVVSCGVPCPVSTFWDREPSPCPLLPSPHSTSVPFSSSRSRRSFTSSPVAASA